MKRTKIKNQQSKNREPNLKLGVLAVLLLLLIAGCNTPKKILCRTWKLTDVEFDEKAVDLTAEQKPLLIQQLKDSCLFVFNKDHTYRLKLPQNNEAGTWSFSKKKDTIFTQNNHVGAINKINVLSKTLLDVNTYSKDGVNSRFILAPSERK